MAPNRLNRQFAVTTVDGPNRVWAADLTYIPFHKSWALGLSQLFKRLAVDGVPREREGGLSRVADCLYWMSRYAERAENIARILDVNLQLMLDLPKLGPEEQTALWEPVLRSTGDHDQCQTDDVEGDCHPRQGALVAQGLQPLHREWVRQRRLAAAAHLGA